jgi:hypothetical protein
MARGQNFRGKKPAGSGRKRGSRNKLTQGIKEVIEASFFGPVMAIQVITWPLSLSLILAFTLLSSVVSFPNNLKLTSTSMISEPGL